MKKKILTIFIAAVLVTIAVWNYLSTDFALTVSVVEKNQVNPVLKITFENIGREEIVLSSLHKLPWGGQDSIMHFEVSSCAGDILSIPLPTPSSEPVGIVIIKPQDKLETSAPLSDFVVIKNTEKIKEGAKLFWTYHLIQSNSEFRRKKSGELELFGCEKSKNFKNREFHDS